MQSASRPTLSKVYPSGFGRTNAPEDKIHVIDYLKQNSLESLTAKYGIKVTRHPAEPLVICNYSQTESDKRCPLVQECRGLTLNTETWEVQARSFSRFFNLSEVPEIEKRFNWHEFAVEEKCDGSLMVLYWYKGEWRVNTRGSFAQGRIHPDFNKTWSELFFELLGDPQRLPLKADTSYVFELCSRLNPVVRDYPEPTLYLLSAFDNKSGREENDVVLDRLAERAGVKRPARYALHSEVDILRFVAEHPEATFEGVVLRDKNGLRLKVKNPRYTALHHLADNGNIQKSSRLVELVFKGEAFEAAKHLPQYAQDVFRMVEKVGGLKARTEAVWDWARGEASQKSFALKVKDEPLSGVLFEARKRQDLKTAWETRAEGSLIKLLAD